MSKKLSFTQKVFHILPGLGVCILIAIASSIIGNFINLGVATISIFLGILIGNTIGTSDVLKKGTKFSESTLLSISVVLLGATLSINTLLDLGVRGILYIILQMTITVIGVIWIGRKLNLGTDFILLMASGNTVCGSSAVASTAPVINAHSRDKGIAITLVNVTGTVLMILLPLLTSLIYNNELNQTSAFLGGILQSVGQVVAAGSMVSEEVKDLALIYKIVRVILLVVVVFAMASIKKKSPVEGIEAVEDEIHSNTHQSRIRVPWYIIGFFIACAIFSLGLIPTSWVGTIKKIDNYIEIIALAGIGMRVYVPDLLKQGKKIIIYCGYIAIIQVVSATLLIKLLF